MVCRWISSYHMPCLILNLIIIMFAFSPSEWRVWPVCVFACGLGMALCIHAWWALTTCRALSPPLLPPHTSHYLTFPFPILPTRGKSNTMGLWHGGTVEQTWSPQLLVMCERPCELRHPQNRRKAPRSHAVPAPQHLCYHAHLGREERKENNFCFACLQLLLPLA